MDTIRTIAWMKEYARQARTENRIVGLVPTMGALHEGHLSLLRRAGQQCSTVIASIFVNPKQFGPKEDYARYPRTAEADSQRLISAGVDSLFTPEAAEVYPTDFSTYVTVAGLSERLEGRHRAGHFRGVTTVVLKLLEIVRPNFVYFGRKDAQQARIVTQMVRDLNVDTQIVVCPIVREGDGLALSSRNAYLNADERRAATVLFRALDKSRQGIVGGERGALELEKVMRQVFSAEPRAAVDYAQVVDASTFEPVTRVSRACYALVAAFIGKSRLIDNMLIEPAGAGTDELVVHL